MLLGWALSASAQQYHALRLLDLDGQPFACATLTSTNRVRWQTDETGIAAVYEPGLESELVWFTPSGPFVAPTDWLGLSGWQVQLEPGGTTEFRLERTGPDPDCALADSQLRLFERGVPGPAEHHALQVIDAQTQQPVPAVRVLALGQEHWTDNGGRVAFFDLDAMDEPVRFDIWTHGYSHDPGYIEIVPAPGGSTTIELDRNNQAERLARLTGGGIWRDTVLLGLPAPLEEPVLDTQVFGQDTAHAVLFRGGLFWLWGDTNRPSYPLGNFRTTGALAALDATPEDGLDLDYFENGDGFVASIAPVHPEGPTWMSGLVALSDEELWGSFVVVDGSFEVYHHGMARWDDDAQAFLTVVEWPLDAPIAPGSPAIRYEGPDGDWVFYRNLLRIPADPASLADPSTYQAYTPLVPDGSGDYDLLTVDGVPDWQWRSGAPAPEMGWVDEGRMPREHSPWHNTSEPDTGANPVMHAGSLAWNPWRQRWVQVFTESFGSTSLIGEIWYVEGDTPVGPWSWARKVITHDNYSFYNPYMHPWFSSRGGKRILFEGTYTSWLGTDDSTPRHDYNQFFYGLDLDAPEMALPVPFYETEQGPRSRRHLATDAPVWFGAQELPSEGRVAVRWTAPECDPDRELAVDGPGETVFYAMPGGTEGPGLMPLNDDDGNELVRVWAPTWQPPVPLSLYPAPERADAGPDQCGASSPVQLDGQASTLSGGITSWTWAWEGGSVEGERAELELPPGLRVVTLTVAGPSGEATDTLAIEVIEGAGGEPPGETGDTSEPGTGPVGDKPSDGPTGCQCDTGRAPSWGSALALGLLLRRRRRA
jgi:hypothetical protein